MKYILLKRVFLFLIIWIILTDADISSLWIGSVSILLASIISLWLNPPVFWNTAAFIKFIPFYFLRSLMGGVDVMLRVFHPALPINPGLVQYRLHIQKGIAQDMIVNILNLLPGTLCVDLKNDLLLIHVLDIDKNIQKEVSVIEEYIHNIFIDQTDKKGRLNEKV